MKQSLLVFILLMFAFSMQAQMVLIKDSMVNNFSEGFHLPAITTDYIYNHSCLLDTLKSPSAQFIYSYYPNGTVYQVVSQNYVGNGQDSTYTIRTYGRSTYTYNEKDKVVTKIEEELDPISETLINSSKDSSIYNQNNYKTVNFYQLWDKATAMFINYSKGTIVYDGNNRKINETYYRWDTTSKTWGINNGQSFYYSSLGLLDSSVEMDHYNYGNTSKHYFTYYSTGKLFQNLSYYFYDSLGTLNYTSRERHYYDSANYVIADSIITDGGENSHTSLGGEIGKLVTHYDENNNDVEDDYFVIRTITLSDFKYSRTYHIFSLCPSILPVTLLNFTAERQNNNTLLHWQTANETNTSSFSIQRSTDGEHFTTVGSIAALGNSSLNRSYTYTDANAFLQTVPKLYYRLAETDKNGVITFSKTVTLDVAAGKLSVYISPNPVVNRINMYATATLNSAIITVTDMKGRIVYSASQTIGAGSRISIDASGFAKGMYIVTIRSAASKQQLKIVKE